MVFKHKSKKNSLQITIPENPDNNEGVVDTYMDLMYMGSRKTQDLLNKLEHGNHGQALEGMREAG